MVQTRSPWRILYIENDEQEFILLREALTGATQREIRLDWAASSEEARLQLAARPYDAVLVSNPPGGQSAADIVAALPAQAQVAFILDTALDSRATGPAQPPGGTLRLVRRDVPPALLEQFISQAIERKHLQQALRASRQWAEHLLDTGFEGVLSVDVDGCILLANPRAGEIFGYAVEEIQGRSVFDLLLAEDRQEARQTLARIAAGESGRVEVHVHRSDGSDLWLLISFAPLLDQDGCFQSALAMFNDITERKIIEEASRASAARDAFRLRLADVLRLLTDPVEIQAAAARLLGAYLEVGRAHYAEISEDEATCFIYIDYCRPDLRSLVGAHRFDRFGRGVKAAIRAGETLAVADVTQAEGLSARQQSAYADLNIRAYVSAPLIRDGRPRAVLSVNQDAARVWTEGEVALVVDTAERTWEALERARAMAALRESEQRFRIMADGTPVMIWVTDAAGKIEFVNRAYSRFFGVSVEGVTVSGWQPLVHPDDAAQYVDTFLECLRKRLPFRAQTRVLRQDGEWRWVDSHGQPRISSAGLFLGMAGSSLDITARMQAEHEERRYAEELERSNQALRDFASIASHDLQEPLRKVRSFGRLLAERYGGRLDEEGNDYLTRMVSAAGRMETMLRSLLDLTRVSSQGNTFVEVDLNRVAADVLNDLEARILETGGQVELLDLPVIQADPLQMRQLLQNLIGNALKFHRPETPPRVTVACQPAGDERVMVIVQDNGIGFDMKNAAQIFDPFVRLHPRLSYEGTGMGLPICKKIAERHNGSISAEGKPGQGSMFRVVLPVKQSHLSL